jgi:putative inorganic carbon (hco3(-)) transporter
MPLRSIAFLVYFLGSTAASAVVPMIGVICYVVLYHVYPQTTWWGLHLNFLGIRYSFVCGVALLIGTTLNLTRLRFGRRAIHPLEGCMLLMLFVILLSTLVEGDWASRTQMYLDKMAKVVLFTLILSHVVVTREQLWKLTFVFALLALYLGHEAHIAPPSAFAQNRLNGIGGPDFRESSGLAIHLLALLPFVAVLLLQRAWWLRGLGLVAAVYAVNAIILCRARSAFLGAIAAAICALVYVPRRYRRWVTCMLVLGACGGVVLSDNWFRERMVTILNSAEERDKSAASRLEIWAAAWEMIKDNPLGVGIGQFSKQIGRYADNPEIRGRDAHNTFVLCAGELGLPGLMIYLATLITAWMTLSAVSRRLRKDVADRELLVLLVFANRLALVVYWVSGLFASRLYTEGAWWLIVMPVCLSRAVENSLRDQVRIPVLETVPDFMALPQWPEVATT